MKGTALAAYAIAAVALAGSTAALAQTAKLPRTSWGDPNIEGTYTNTFSGNPCQTPRYEYNQIMYRVDLSDERLKEAQTE